MPDNCQLERELELAYDGECPVCRFYSRKIDISEGSLLRVDARSSSQLMDEITAAGLDIDRGMVLRDGDTLYFGSDAMHQLALRSSGQGVFNRIVALVFRSRRASRLLYPVLVACRNLLLKIRGKSRINNLGKDGDDRF